MSAAALSLQRLQEEIETAEFHLRKAKNESPQELDDWIRLSDWLDGAYARESKLQAKVNLERFFGESIEVEDVFVERVKFKVEVWKDGVSRKVARGLDGRFVSWRKVS